MKNWILGGIAMSLFLAPDGASAQNNFPLVPATLVKPRGGIGNVLAKLNAGRDVKIAYFGGSITAADGWRPKSLKWFQQTWPNAKISEVNAAIGGTGSDLGVYRNQQDVLNFKPDLVFVEFAVNDGGASPENIWRGMEGIVRQTWKANPETDIAFVYTLHTGMKDDLKKGMHPRSASAMEKLADYYNIPSISVALKMTQMAEAGTLIYVPEKDADGKDKPAPEGIVLFSTDGVHPLDAAHQIYAEVVADAIKAMMPDAKTGAHELKAPLQADNWENAKIVPLQQSMLSPGWKKLNDASPFKGFFNRMPEMWEATQPGEKLMFRFKGTAVKLYDLLGPDGAKVKITLDGKESIAQRFDSYSSYHRLATLWIAENLPDTEHAVSVEILPEQPDRSIVTNIEKVKPGFDPKRYDGTAMRVGGIMLIGDLVP